jgi:molybdopterin/thiamine biosynthesis adenylyltransferase
VNDLITRRLESMSELAPGPEGAVVRVLRDGRFSEIAAETGCSIGSLHEMALQQGILPLRYLANLGCLNLDDQLRLAGSCAAVVGVGGLGGHVVQLLARLGIGRLVAVDHDVFEETNLNRQLFADTGVLGKPKVEAASRAVSNINPGVAFVPWEVRLDNENCRTLLEGADVVIDALDNVSDRLILENGVRGLDLPLVHGAVSALEAHLMTILPGDLGLKGLYGDEVETWEGEATRELLSVFAPTPALLGAAMAMEAVKILLDWSPVFRWTPVLVRLDTLEIDRRPEG